jgi:hypothetical protein
MVVDVRVEYVLVVYDDVLYVAEDEDPPYQLPSGADEVYEDDEDDVYVGDVEATVSVVDNGAAVVGPP